MKKRIFINIVLGIVFMGCNTNTTPYQSNNDSVQFAVKEATNAYGKKYHFIIERQWKSRSKDVTGLLGRDKHISQYHIYTNSLGKVKGNYVLFDPLAKNYKVKELNEKSIVIFKKNEIVLKNIQICFEYMTPQCSDSGLNGKYLIKDSSLLSKNHDTPDLQGGIFQ